MPLARFFGPLSANDPALHGLSKLEALVSIRSRIRALIKELAPPRPIAQPPHDPLCRETGPWLWLGTGDRMYAACWYQTCMTCEPVVLRFITPPVDASLVTGNSALGILFDVYQEVKSHPDDEEGDSSDAVSNAQDKDDSDDGDSDKGEESGTESSEGGGGSNGGGSIGEQSSLDDDGEPSRLIHSAQPAPFPMPSPLQEWFD